jgi:hypothetical protein
MARRKIFTTKYCRKDNPDSRTLQNVFRSLIKSDLFLKISKTIITLVMSYQLLALQGVFPICIHP